MSSCPLPPSWLQDRCLATHGVISSSMQCCDVSAQAVESLLVMVGLRQDGATVLCLALLCTEEHRPSGLCCLPGCLCLRD